MSMAERVMRRFYVAAKGDPSRLPWHREEPAPLLADTVLGMPAGARVLDVGCGAGVFAVWMSGNGMQVTGIDMMPEAIDMARERARTNEVEVTWLYGDLFAFEPDQPFDLVFDSGCLHSLVGGDPKRYKGQLLAWMKRDGCFVLEHWGKRNRLDWRRSAPDGGHLRSSRRSSAPTSCWIASTSTTSPRRCRSARRFVVARTGSACRIGTADLRH